MKKIYITFIAVLITAILWAQSPNKVSYQAVVRNAVNELLAEQVVGMRVSIIQGDLYGTSVYVEIQTPTSNSNGLISIEIGAGVVQMGNFSTIDWANGPYFIKTETDVMGAENYTILSISQLLSVPYALHAKTAESLSGEIIENDPLYMAWDKSYLDLTSTPNIIDSIVTVLDSTKQFLRNEVDGDNTNEIQSFSVSNLGDTLHLNKSNFVIIPGISVANYFTQVSPTDIDGNIYSTVKIGSQIWMSENLKVTHFNDGTAIPLVTDNSAWGNLEDNDVDKAYCHYNNNEFGEAAIYGALYTYAAAKDACPVGWHLPTDNEWLVLANSLGGESIAGGKMKEAGTEHWESPNMGADNSSGFTALPGGVRYTFDGSFVGLESSGYWWSITEESEGSPFALGRVLNSSLGSVGNPDGMKGHGFSVRCVKD